MCWFSAEHVNKVIEEAKAGQRLGIKKMHWDRNWVVGETELEASRPCPVCLNDQTRVLFRLARYRARLHRWIEQSLFSESQQASLHVGSDEGRLDRIVFLLRRDFNNGRT
jgi:hypothetical protein